MRKEDFEKNVLGHKLGDHVTYIDMDETKVIERKTFGWTDEQIMNKSVAELDAMVRSASMAIASLEESVEGEKERKRGMLEIRNRRVELGE